MRVNLTLRPDLNFFHPTKYWFDAVTTFGKTSRRSGSTGTMTSTSADEPFLVGRIKPPTSPSRTSNNQTKAKCININVLMLNSVLPVWFWFLEKAMTEVCFCNYLRVVLNNHWSQCLATRCLPLPGWLQAGAFPDSQTVSRGCRWAANQSQSLKKFNTNLSNVAVLPSRVKILTQSGNSVEAERYNEGMDLNLICSVKGGNILYIDHINFTLEWKMSSFKECIMWELLLSSQNFNVES